MEIQATTVPDILLIKKGLKIAVFSPLGL